MTEVSRATLELQALSLRVESLDAKVEFNERRVRGIEGSVHRARPQAAPGTSSGAVRRSARRRQRPNPRQRKPLWRPPPKARRPRRAHAADAAAGAAAVRGWDRARVSRWAGRRGPTGIDGRKEAARNHRDRSNSVPDTGITEAPPVPFERTSAPAPFEHPVPTPLDHAPVEPCVDRACTDRASADGRRLLPNLRPPPPPSPEPPAAAEAPPSAPDPERHEY